MSLLLERLKAAKVVAVMRCEGPEEVFWAGQALMAGGITALEVTLTTPGAMAGIAALRAAAAPDVLIGAGTVLEEEAADEAISLGAEFVVSPILSIPVVQKAKHRGVLSLPGAFSPTEVWTAWEAGADVVKVFPAGTVGPSYFRDLHGPFPGMRLMPTGGVSPVTIPEWFAAGAFAVGAGTALLPRKALAERDEERIIELARAHLAACP